MAIESLVGFAIIFFWLAILTTWLYKTVAHYKRLVHGASGSDLKAVLEKLIVNESSFTQNLKSLESEVKRARVLSKGYIQKMGLVRFSPYSETGGNQSFALALLSGDDTGVVILSLHARDGTRFYIKAIEKGVSKYTLSKEEKLALEEAKKSKN